MKMEIVRIDEVKEARTPRKIEVRKVLRKKDVQVVYLKFKPGEELPLHTTKVDVFFYVIEGQGKVTVGGEEEMVKEKEIIFSPADVPHALENVGGGLFKMLVVKTPNPEM
jgi:quercetin dioxygenase-like cupin family protein